MFVRKFTVPVTTASGGGATVVTAPIRGVINRIEYVKDDFADGVDFAISITDGPGLWTQDDVNASAARYPLIEGHKADGTTQTGAFVPVAVADDTVTIAVTNGGDTKSGTFVFTVIG